MTLDGTNTWVLRAGRRAVVVDPGPDHAGHLRAVADAAGPVALVLLTHGHPDHSDGAPAFADLVRAPVRALDPRHRLGDQGLAEGDVVAVDGLELRVLATPGHSGDSLCFTLAGDEPAVLTGDTILGRGTTVVAHPDGRLADYLVSLERLRALGAIAVLPGHGDPLPDAAAVAQFYLDHRAERLDQIRAALANGARTAEDVVETVYVDVDRAVWPAATLSVRAQLDYLAERATAERRA